jgi:hypothetical protein
MHMTSLALVATSLLLSAPAASDQNNSSMENKVVTALTGDQLGDGPVIELDLLGLFLGANQFASAAGATPYLVVPTVSVGYEWDQNAALVGLTMAFIGGTGGANGPVEIGIPVTFRHYLKPVALYSFSPFVQGEFDMNFVVPGGQGLSFGFGIKAGIGGEYVFAHNFGLFGEALLGYQHIPTSLLGNTTSADTFGIGGLLGVLIHF